MKKSDITNILQVLERLEAIVPEQIVAEVYPDKNPSEVFVREISASDLISYYRQFIKLIRENLSTENSLFFPLVFNTEGQNSNNLLTILKNVETYWKNKDLASIDDSIQRIGFYLLNIGAISNGMARTSMPDTGEIQKLLEEVKIIQRQSLDVNKKSNANFLKMTDSAKEYETLFIEKKKQLEQVAANVASSNAETLKIGTLLNQSTEIKGKIDSILEQEKTKLDDLEKTKIKETKRYEELDVSINERLLALQQHDAKYIGNLSAFDEKLEYVEGKKEFFEQRIKYLDELIEREVGSQLYSTFKIRKEELVKNVHNWKWWVIGSGAFALLLLSLFQTEYFSNFHNLVDWEKSLATIVKTSPAIIFWYFCLVQYSKERKLEEQYAFKSTVALTIRAYADLLATEGKDGLIKQSVENLYTPPWEEQAREKLSFFQRGETKEFISLLKQLIKKAG